MTQESSNIHPQLQAVAGKGPKMTFGRKNVWFINLLMRLMPAPKIGDDLLVENISIPGPAGGKQVRLRTYKPASAARPAPALLWLHGGGYVSGNPKMDDLHCAEFARQLGISVYSVDYRYAPKHPFPAGLDDSYAALKWLADNAPQLGVDSARIAIGGASAGGGLAAALAQLAHDRQEVAPIFQLLVYPMLDDRTVLRPGIDESDYLVWSAASNRFGWGAYLGASPGAAQLPPYAAPARRESLAGLPPAWIGVGSADMFHEEGAAYAQRLAEEGVDCQVEIVPGAFHGFDVFDRELPLVKAFHQAQIEALKNGLLGGE